jgi:transcriptional regulator GlxA family with amidase domain
MDTSPAPSAPVRVAVPLLTDCPLFELSVACEVFGKPRIGPDRRWYDLTVFRTVPGPQSGPGGLLVDAAPGPEAMEEADLVVVPACRMPSYRAPEDLVEGLRRAHARGARIAALCSGAFVLAEAGLLNGRGATTHWMYAPELRRRHPRVRVAEDALYVDEGDVLTSAGSAAAIDLCTHIVRGDFGAAAAAEVGRRMVVAPHREGGQTQYAPDPAERGSAGMAPVLAWAMERLAQPLSVPDLAREAGMSTRGFTRHFTAEVGTTPLAWLNRQRVARARVLLETTDLPVAVVARRSGLGTDDGLRQHFRRHLGTTPSAYRRAFRGPSPA